MPRKPLSPEQIKERNERLARAREQAARNRSLRASPAPDTETPAAQTPLSSPTSVGTAQSAADTRDAARGAGSPQDEAKRDRPAAAADSWGRDVSRGTEHETLQQPMLGREALGKLAHAIHGNPVVDEAFRRAITETVQLWERTEPHEREKREDLYHEMRAVRALKHQIGRIAQEGRMAEIRADRLKAV